MKVSTSLILKKKFISQADTKSGRNAILLHCMDMPINIGKVKKREATFAIEIYC